MITMGKKHELELRETAEAYRAEGFAEGVAEIEARYERSERLTDLLLDADRFEDLRRMRNDMAYREQLYAEFGI